MAIVHADNFNIYGTNTGFLTNGIYAQADNNIQLVNDPDGISPAKVLKIGPNNFFGPVIRYVLPATSLNCGVSHRIWLATLPPDNQFVPTITSYRDGANAILFELSIDSTGRIVAKNVSGTVIGTSTLPAVTATGWYHIESKIVINAATGSIEVRVEGQTVLNLTNINTGSTAVSQIACTGYSLGGDTKNTQHWMKDLVVWNNLGSLNNTFLGPVLVTNLVPTGDAALNWTPSTGTNGWSILDNIPPDDTKYLSAPYNAGGPPFYPSPYKGILSDLPIEAVTVKGLVSFVRAAKADGGDGSIQVGIISDPSGAPATALGVDRPITVAQTYWRDIFEVDPKTGVPWLPAAVNAAQIQLNRTT